MKPLLGILSLVFAVFWTIIGGQPETRSPIRTFPYKHAVHPYLAPLMREVNGHALHFQDHTLLAVRGELIFGWVNVHNTIQPIYYQGNLVVYDLDEHRLLNKTKGQLTAYGVNGVLPEIDNSKLDPMRIFHYEPKLHNFLVPLRKQILSRNYEFDAETVLVARSGTLFGWVNEEDDVEPIFLNNYPTTYDLYEHTASEANLVQLVTLGVFKKLPASLSGAEIPPSQSRTRSPRIWRENHAESSARHSSPGGLGGNNFWN